MRINVMEKGDSILNVTSEAVMVKRKSGEVDIIPFMRDETGLRIDMDNIVTIGYGKNTVVSNEVDGVVITNF